VSAEAEPLACTDDDFQAPKKSYLRVKPLGDRVWVERLEGEEKIGHVYLAETYKDQAQLGRVIAAGPGPLTEWPREVSLSGPIGRGTMSFERHHCTVKRGDLVLFGKYSGTVVPVVLEGQQHEIFLLREEEILAVLEEIDHKPENERTLG
jgi:co-chaperonin GroES (HSP10)